MGYIEDKRQRHNEMLNNLFTQQQKQSSADPRIGSGRAAEATAGVFGLSIVLYLLDYCSVLEYSTLARGQTGDFPPGSSTSAPRYS